MATSTQLETAIQLVKELLAKEATTPEEMRANFAEATSKFNQVAKDIKYQTVDAGGVKAEWIAAPNAVEKRVLMFLHGGSYMVCSVSTHRDLISRLARSAAVRALGVDYRLAPEHTFPAAVEDATAAYRWMISSGVNPTSVVIAGDSAGGGLTLATLIALRDAGDPLPAAAVCMSPWVDLECLGESMITKADVDPFVSREIQKALAQQYLGDADPRTPLAAPLYADLAGLPPMLIQVGSSETLLDDATRLAKRAKAAGVEASLDIWEDMIHGWQIFAPFLPEGQQAIENIGAFIRSHVR